MTLNIIKSTFLIMTVTLDIMNMLCHIRTRHEYCLVFVLLKPHQKAAQSVGERRELGGRGGFLSPVCTHPFSSHDFAAAMHCVIASTPTCTEYVTMM